MATENPAEETRSATASPAGPEPATTRSNVLGFEGSKRGRVMSGKILVECGGAEVAGVSGTPGGAAVADAFVMGL